MGRGRLGELLAASTPEACVVLDNPPPFPLPADPRTWASGRGSFLFADLDLCLDEGQTLALLGDGYGTDGLQSSLA
jgi:hypothetical protein